MAGTKGKIGGRKIVTNNKEYICDRCQTSTSTITRVKSCSSTGKSKMIWLCTQCLKG